MATFDLGRVTPLYKGDYSASASYELNDVVLYNGNLYWHIQATATVGIAPTDTTVWKLAFSDEGVRAEIRGYADDAQVSKTAAATSASNASASASNASASASQAALSAQTAGTKASEASTSAQTASTKASEASTSAQSAASSAQSATDKATLATNKAQAASESATLATAKANAAATSETNAAASAQTATAKASEAAASATSAQEYDESAQASAVNAQTAQGLAETAQAAAETAQGLAEDARDLAQQYAESIDPEHIYSAYPTDTASGAVASFSDGADDIPLKSLVVDINPVQDLSQGDPSPENICPISGWTGMTVSRTGINQWDEEWEAGNLDAQGRPVSVPDTIRSKNYCGIVGGESYYVYSPKVDGDSQNRYYLKICFYDANKNFISNLFGNRMVVTAPANAVYFKIATNTSIVVYGGTYNHDISINYPSTDHDYHEGHTQNVTVDWQTEAGTVYGGHLDVLSGVLTVDRAMVDLGTLTWNLHAIAGYGEYFWGDAYALGIKYEGNYHQTYYHALCSQYSVANRTQALQTNKMLCFDGSDREVWQIQIKDSDYSDATAFKTAMSGVQLCYQLATPITYTLTPTEIKSLLGENNIWADTGDCSVEYRADTKMYIERLTEPDADMIADSNIVSGQYFLVGNSLYLATSNIASGGQVIVGTNCTRKSLATALNEINQ